MAPSFWISHIENYMYEKRAVVEAQSLQTHRFGTFFSKFSMHIAVEWTLLLTYISSMGPWGLLRSEWIIFTYKWIGSGFCSMKKPSLDNMHASLSQISSWAVFCQVSVSLTICQYSYTPGWREAIRESIALPKFTTLHLAWA